MAYDPRDDLMVLFGGADTSLFDVSGGSFIGSFPNDTWAYRP